MTPDCQDKQAKIIEELKRHTKEMKFGVLTVEFSISEGKIVAGEIIGERRKLSY